MMTDWYPEHIKPVRVGVYEVEPGLRRCYSYFDGQNWGWITLDLDFAKEGRDAHDEIRYSSLTWRGFTTPQE